MLAFYTPVAQLLGAIDTAITGHHRMHGITLLVSLSATWERLVLGD